MSRLAVILAERGVIDTAVKLGQSRQHRLATERTTEIWASYFPEIAEIEKRRVTLTFRARPDLGAGVWTDRARPRGSESRDPRNQFDAARG